MPTQSIGKKGKQLQFKTPVASKPMTLFAKMQITIQVGILATNTIKVQGKIYVGK